MLLLFFTQTSLLLLPTFPNFVMYPCTVEAAQNGSVTQRTYAEKKEQQSHYVNLDVPNFRLILKI